MNAYPELISTIALVLGLGWASGINLYAAIAALGIAGATGYVDLPVELKTVQDPLVIGAAVLMYAVEFLADKTPGVDTAWDTIHTFIRIPAGALLAAGAVGDVAPALQISAGLVGGAMATGSHFTKASSRVLINTSPEPLSNWGASIGEDVLVLGGLWAMLNYPWLFVAAMIVFVALVIWLAPKLWRLVKAVFQRIGTWLGIYKDPRKRERPAVSSGATDTVIKQASTGSDSTS